MNSPYTVTVTRGGTYPARPLTWTVTANSVDEALLRTRSVIAGPMDHEKQIRIAGVTPGFGTLAWWERAVEWLHWKGQPLAERWECWDSVQGRWRRYWRHNGSLPEWSRR